MSDEACGTVKQSSHQRLGGCALAQSYLSIMISVVDGLVLWRRT